MNCLRLMFGVIAIATTMVMWTSDGFAEAVRVRVSQGSDFGRIVFHWERPVSHEVIHQGRALTVRFGRPISASYQRVLGVLADYIDRIQPGSDGRSVTFHLTGAYETFGFDSGNAIIVEVARIENPQPIETTESASTVVSSRTTKIAAQSVPASDIPKIRVRTGVHDTYTRMVFDWPNQVTYAVQQSGGVVTVRFGAAAQLLIQRLQKDPPPLVGGLRARPGDKETVLTMAVPKTSRVKHFLSGSKIVLDVQRPTGTDEIAALPPEQQQQAAAPKVSPVSPPAPKSDGQAQEAGRVSGNTTPSKPPEAKVPAAAPAKTAVAGEPSAAVEKPKAAAAAQETSGQATGSDTKAIAAPQAAETASGAAAAPVALRPVSVERAPVPKKGEAGADNAGTGDKAADSAEKPASAGVRFKFDWDEPVAAAVFRRVGYIWVIFDKAGKIDVQSLLQAGGNIIQSIDQAPSPKATVLRIKVSSRINPKLSRDGLSWIIEFGVREPSVATPVEIKAQPNSPVGARIFLPVPEPGQPVGITDPAVGDNLVVVPVIPLGHGVQRAYTYSQVKLLPSAQGIVIQPLVDDLRIRPLRQGVELTSGGKLALSAVSADIAASAKLSASRPLTKILELDKWELPSLAKFTSQKQELQLEIAASRGEQRELKRFNLVRFYFANQFAAETLGVLGQIKLDRPKAEDQPEFRLIRGGASYLMGRLSDAAADFTHESLDGKDEANFWRAAVVAASGDMLAAAPELKRTGVVTQKYPRALKLLMGTLVADAAVEIGDIKTAKAFVEALKALKPHEAQLAAIEFVEGRLLDLGGDSDGAITKWEAVQEMRNRTMRAKATIARMELLLKLERMPIKEAIEELEKLRFAWRGDDFEFDLLRRLGGLYLDEGIYRNGLQALRQAATYFRDNEAAPQVTQQMADIFNMLYLDDGADAMPAVTAIAVYEEFKELTPAGAKGDEMIRKLADRLADVDLLDQAAEILEGQIRFRLNGVLKSEVGARLAIVYLLARRYDRAFAALDATTTPGQPEALTSQRRHLRARALMGLSRRDDALALLKPDKATDADLLRSEIYWNAGDWANASTNLRKIVRASGAKKDEPVTPDQAQKVLNYSISLVLSGNERGLARVRREYGPAIQTTQLKDAFQLVSAPTALGLISPGSVISRVKLAENFKTFMSEYKKRLQEQGLSGVTAQKTADAEAKEPDTKGG